MGKCDPIRVGLRSFAPKHAAGVQTQRRTEDGRRDPVAAREKTARFVQRYKKQNKTTTTGASVCVCETSRVHSAAHTCWPRLGHGADLSF